MANDLYYTPREVLEVNALEGAPDLSVMKDLAERMEVPQLGNPPFEMKGGAR